MRQGSQGLTGALAERGRGSATERQGLTGLTARTERERERERERVPSEASVKELLGELLALEYCRRPDDVAVVLREHVLVESAASLTENLRRLRRLVA